MQNSQGKLCSHERLEQIVKQSEWLMDSLEAVRDLQLTDWCIGAGAIRNLVWDFLHGYKKPSFLTDIDVAYFDANVHSTDHDHLLQQKLNQIAPSYPWEVTNQASVHSWFESYFGHSVPALHSLEEAISTWPEYATCVGIRLDDNDNLTIISPYGLNDLFDIVVRRNPKRVSEQTYLQRIQQKKYQERWPKVTVIA